MKELTMGFLIALLMGSVISCEKSEFCEDDREDVCGVYECDDVEVIPTDELPSNTRDYIAQAYPDEYISVAFRSEKEGKKGKWGKFGSCGDDEDEIYTVTLRNENPNRLDVSRTVIFDNEGLFDQATDPAPTVWKEDQLAFQFPISVVVGSEATNVACADASELAAQKDQMTDFVYPLTLIKDQTETLTINTVDDLKAAYTEYDKKN